MDVFVSTVDPMKEPPLITANTVLSILAVDYPIEKVACYVSDDGAAMLTFEALSETSEFARKWVPFCKKFSIEPRAPEWYFAQKVDYLRDKVEPTFVRERRAMKVPILSLTYWMVICRAFPLVWKLTYEHIMIPGKCKIEQNNSIKKLVHSSFLN